MIYADARSLIKSGDVLAWRGTGPFARIIEWVTGGSYSHVGIAYWLEDRLMVIQQKEFRGQDMAFLSDHLPFYWIATRLILNEQSRSIMFEQLEHPYSYLDAIRVGLRISAKRKGRICSTFVAEVLNTDGYFISDEIQTPSSLIKMLSQSGLTVINVT